MTRLSALSKLLNVPKEMFFTRTTTFTGKPPDETEDEFILRKDGSDIYYSVYKSNEEIEARLESMKEEFGEEVGDDIDSVLTFIGDKDGYKIYQN